MTIGFDIHTVGEFVAHWLGGTSLDELGDLLGYAPHRLGALIRGRFERHRPATIHYSRQAKRWLSVSPSAALHGPRTTLDAITTLQAMRVWRRGATPEALFPVEDVRAFRRPTAPDTFRTLLGACVRRQVVDVTYQTRTRELTLAFSPHTLVVAPHREHFRGYSSFELDGRDAFWDLVPSRVLSAVIRPRLGHVGIEHDEEWHRMRMLRLTLRADLPATMRQAIRYEHGIDTDMLEVGPVREALLPYVRGDLLDRRYEGFSGPVWEVC